MTNQNRIEGIQREVSNWPIDDIEELISALQDSAEAFREDEEAQELEQEEDE